MRQPDLHRQGRWAALVSTVLVAALGASPSPAEAQQFRPESRRTGNLDLRVLEQPYTIRGNTAQAIYDGLRSQSPGWMDFEPNYTWRYQPNDDGNGFCRVAAFELYVNMRVTYPRWDIPENADPKLVAAWEDFVAQMRARWDARAEDERRFARSLETRMRRVREPCDHIGDMMQRHVDRAFEAEGDARQEAFMAGEGVDLEWPPPGHGQPVDPDAAPQPVDAVAQGIRRGERVGLGSGLPVRESDLFVYPDFPSSFQVALAQDFDRPTVQQAAMVLAILRDGQVLGTQAAGTDPRTDDAPAVDAVFPFPALAEFLVAVLVNALEVNGILDTTVPIGAYLPALPEAVGAATLDQLLGHRAGLQNGPLPLDRILAERGEAALFTEPGAVFSYSRHSFPLAVQVVEAVVGSPIDRVLQAAVLDPFQLPDTRLGFEGVELARLAPSVPDPTSALGAVIPADLPVIYTTIPDVARMVARFGNSAALGVDVQAVLDQAELEGTDWVWSHGLWWTGGEGVQRATLVCGPRWTGVGTGFTLLPESGTGVVLWATDTWPHQAARWILDSAVQGMEVERDPYPLPGPLELSSMEVESWTRCPYPTDVNGMEAVPVSEGEPLNDGAWEGTYFNGPDAISLVMGARGLLVDGSEPELRVHILGESQVVAADEEGRYLIPLRLVEDAAGRRYLVIQGRAYLHEGDGGGPG